MAETTNYKFPIPTLSGVADISLVGDAIEDIDSEIKKVSDEKAPENHASSATTYGVGTSSNYGHVKLSDSTNSTSGVTDGTAATPSAVKAAYDLANSKASVSSALIPYADIYVDNVHISGRDDNYVTLECDNIDGILYTDANNIGIGEDFLIKDQIESRAKGETIDASDIDNITETGVYYVEGMINDDNEDEILLIVVRGNTRIAQYTFSDDDTIRYRTKTITGNWASGWGMIHDPHAAPINHASTSEVYGLASATTFGHVRLSDNTTSNANVTAGIAATPAAVKAAYDLANSKAGKENDEGGFIGGRGANVTNSGGAVGAYTYATSGGAVGDTAKSASGGAMGEFAESTEGGAVGCYAKTSDGAAIGYNAKTVDSSDNAIDAIQLGTGTNSTAKTMQVYDKRIVEADGNLTDVGNLSALATTNKTNIVNAINELYAMITSS